MVDAAPLTLWVLVTSTELRPEEDAVVTSRGKKRLLSVKIWPHWSAREVQGALLEALGPGHPRANFPLSAVQLRDPSGALLPLTPVTLRSSPRHPLRLEICPVGCGDDPPLLPPSFRETVEVITRRLEARVAAVEEGLTGLEGRRAAQLEEELRRIQDTLGFMSRRLDLTRAPAWVTGDQSTG